MNLFTFLQSIVSIAFIYLVLSLFTSEIQEYLAAIFESRAKRLKQSIRQMLGEQDYPFVPLTIDENVSSGSKKIWIDPNGVIKAIRYPIYTLSQTVAANGKVWEKNGELMVIKQADIVKIDNQNIWINDMDNSLVNTSEVDLGSMIKNKSKTLGTSIPVTKYPVFTNSGIGDIPSGSKIWIDSDGLIKEVKNNNHSSEYIYAKHLEAGNYEEVNIQLTEVFQDELNRTSNYYYEKGVSVERYPIRYPIYTLSQTVEADGKVWEKNGELSVIKPEDIGKIDNQNIWIKDGDDSPVNTSEVDQAKIDKNKSETLGTSIPVTQYPVFSNVGTQAINSDAKVDAKVWLSRGKTINVIVSKEKPYIYVNEGNKREVNETEVKEDGDSPGDFYNVREIVIKTPVYDIQQGIKTDNANSYFLDIVNKTLFVVNQGNKVILVQIIDISQFNSLTEELYSHRNIKALNQSGFAWLSLFTSKDWLTLFTSKDWLTLFTSKDWLIALLAWLFLISIFAVGVLVFYKQSTIDLRLILGFWLLILGVLSYLLNQSEGDLKTKAPGRNRKSVGPSYIGADAFANTLLDVLRYKTVRGEEDETKRLSTLFYTPAKPILGQWLNELQNRTGADLTPKQLVDGLRDKYETAFNKVQERSSGVYKRNAKGLSFLLGLLLAILLNADTLNFVNKFTQADNTSREEIFKFLSEQQIPQECFKNPNAVGCPDAQNAAFKALRGQFETLNKGNDLPLGWNTDTIQELRNEITLLKGEKDIIKTACDSSGDGQTCLDEINKLLQNNPKLIPIVNTLIVDKDSKPEDDKFINILERANSIEQKYQDLKNKYKIIVKDKINQIVLNLESNNQTGLEKIQKDLETLKALNNCDQGTGKACFDQILEKLKTNDLTLMNIIGSNQNFKSSLLEVVNINNSDLETLRTKYTEIITLKEKELKQLVQAQAPTAQQVNTAVERQGGWLRVLFGWLITAIAISMGAPFWFDLIGRIVNVRNANKPANTTGTSQNSNTTDPPA